MLELLDTPPSELSPFFFVEVEQDWGARHLVRAPYSLNEKTWNVSLPIKPADLPKFSPELSKPDKVVKMKDVQPFFLSQQGCAERLVTDALDWWALQKKETRITPRTDVKREKFEQKISEDNFPPCIKLILAGLKDGKKRSIFTLINFLRFANWSWQDIETKLSEWNLKNSPRIPNSIILSQLRWGMQQNRSVNPANCSNDMFYKSIGICQPDNFCKNRTGEISIKNPLSYPLRKMGVSRRVNNDTNSPPSKSGRADYDANSPLSKDGRADYNKNPLKASSRYVMRGFSCDVCNREFKTMRSLQSHKTRAHGG
jgi:hypothetical protein